MSELVSVIVPSYNHESFIGDCIMSIMEQTYENIEIILVDDFSKDRTFEIASRLLSYPKAKKRFRRIVLERKEQNKGAHHSINLGLSLAQGKFIAIINSDDMYHKNRLSIMISEMKEKEVDLSFSVITLFYKDFENSHLPENIEVSYELYSLPLKQLTLAEDEPTIGFALLRQNIAISTGNLIFTKRLAEKLGGFISLRYTHDWDFILRSLLFTEPLFVKKPLYYYRLHESNTFKGLQHLAVIESEIVLRRFFRAINTIKPLNHLCPSPENWPGYFEFFLKKHQYWNYWIRESGGKETYWRVYETGRDNASFICVLRNIFEKLTQESVYHEKS